MDRIPQFVTSDWHIGHENVIKFDNRPFKDLEHMHRVLVNNFNSCVPSNGVTFFLGDMGLCKADVLRRVIEQLNGTKVLVLGNHDRGVNAMYGMGFDVVVHGLTLFIAGKRVTLSHCPLIGVYREDTRGMKGCDGSESWHGEKKNQMFATHDFGQYHLHGHIHSPNGGKSERVLERQMDVGVAANNYRPVSISVVESWISKRA